MIIQLDNEFYRVNSDDDGGGDDDGGVMWLTFPNEKRDDNNLRACFMCHLTFGFRWSAAKLWSDCPVWPCMVSMWILHMYIYEYAYFVFASKGIEREIASKLTILFPLISGVYGRSSLFYRGLKQQNWRT